MGAHEPDHVCVGNAANGLPGVVRGEVFDFRDGAGLYFSQGLTLREARS